MEKSMLITCVDVGNFNNSWQKLYMHNVIVVEMRAWGWSTKAIYRADVDWDKIWEVYFSKSWPTKSTNRSVLSKTVVILVGTEMSFFC